MKIDTTYLLRCIRTLELSNRKLKELSFEDFEYDIYRAATIKEFEIILELSGKFLRKLLKHYLHSGKAAHALNFKDVFRTAHKHDIIKSEEAERWLEYRDLRNTTTHDYGEEFAEQILPFIDQFIFDSNSLVENINRINDDIKE